jgi:hypothetical protein
MAESVIKTRKLTEKLFEIGWMIRYASATTDPMNETEIDQGREED